MQYEITYKIDSHFMAQVKAESVEHAEAKFNRTNLAIEVVNNIEDGGLDPKEITIHSIKGEDDDTSN